MTTWGRNINRELIRPKVSGTEMIEITVPEDQRWFVNAISFFYATSATAGQRELMIELVVDGDVMETFEAGPAISAGEESHVIFAPGVPKSFGMPMTPTFEPFPALVALPGDTIRAGSSSGGQPDDLVECRVHADMERIPGVSPP